jgi:hypothetical protein
MDVRLCKNLLLQPFEVVKSLEVTFHVALCDTLALAPHYQVVSLVAVEGELEGHICVGKVKQNGARTDMPHKCAPCKAYRAKHQHRHWWYCTQPVISVSASVHQIHSASPRGVAASICRMNAILL